MKTTQITKRPAEERGQANHGWLNARFSFSFADYIDPDHIGFHALRVINNDTIAPGGGFGTHPHRDAEIFSYIVEGQLEHKDSMGNGATIEAGNLQYMSAGSGVRHSEFNPSNENSTTMYQIWIMPNEDGGEPCYEEKKLGLNAKANIAHLLFSGDGREGSTAIRQNADIYFARIEAGKSVSLPASEATPYIWIQVVSGMLRAAGEQISSGDGLALSDAPEVLEINASQESQILMFRLA